MAKQVIMPKFGMDQTEGTVAAWLKQAGDPVEKGEPILEVETDKVNMEVEANASGILAGISANPGDTVPIGQVIAYILQPGEALPHPEPDNIAKSVTPVKATPVAERLAASHGLNLQTEFPSRPGERITRADVEARVTRQSSPITPTDAVRAVPAARRLARELDVDLADLTGSGPDGRIQSRDVRRAATAQPALLNERAVRRQVPLTAMRHTIAERITASARDIPQFTVGMQVDMARALALLADLRAEADEVRVTLTAFLVKVCAWALGRHPALNASFGSEAITEWADINIGLVVSVEQGLLVPVVRHADRLTTLDIAAQVTDLGERARAGKLQPAELQNGTFTVSNLGMLGVDHFTAIINPPEAAILAVSRVAKIPVVTDDNRIEVGLRANLTLTADHRVVDGAKVAQFLADIKKAIEHPGMLL